VLLEHAKLFDPSAWAARVQARSPVPDIPLRAALAAAHRSATLIYLIRVAQICGAKPLEHQPQIAHLVHDITLQLSQIATCRPLLPATAWSAFIAGAEAQTYLDELWAKQHFDSLWRIQPWGVVKGATAALQMIACGLDSMKGFEWVKVMQGGGAQWLIV
jgi:hypothetical protein